MDTVRRFVDDCAELTPGGTALTAAIYTRFKDWAEAQGEFVLPQRRLGERLARLGLKATKGGKEARQWIGSNLPHRRPVQRHRWRRWRMWRDFPYNPLRETQSRD